jgi:hypothetical protein
VEVVPQTAQRVEMPSASFGVGVETMPQSYTPTQKQDWLRIR